MNIEDRIEQSIRIHAPVETVWRLVSEPGWWINDGQLRPHTITHADGVDIVVDEKEGEFPIETVETREPSYVAFRWLPFGGTASEAKAGTLVEFRLEPDDDGVTVTVTESGFAALDLPAEKIRANYRENVEGWGIELPALRTAVEAG